MAMRDETARPMRLTDFAIRGDVRIAVEIDRLCQKTMAQDRATNLQNAARKDRGLRMASVSLGEYPFCWQHASIMRGCLFLLMRGS